METESKTYPDMCVCCRAPIPEGCMICCACENGCNYSKGLKLDKLRVGDRLDDCCNRFRLPVIKFFKLRTISISMVGSLMSSAKKTLGEMPKYSQI